MTSISRSKKAKNTNGLNRRGRKPGTKNPDDIEKLLREIRANAPLLRAKLVEKAVAGDVEAIRLCLDRLDRGARRDKAKVVA